MRITNTLTGEKEAFVPASLPVRMYVCGLTPKHEPHLGHARLFVASDVMRRYLEYRDTRSLTSKTSRILMIGLSRPVCVRVSRPLRPPNAIQRATSVI